MSFPELRRQLNDMLADLQAKFDDARAADDTLLMAKLEDLARPIFDLRNRAALISLAELTERVAALRNRLDGGSGPAIPDIGTTAALRAEIDRLLAESSEDAVVNAPVPGENVVIVTPDITAPAPMAALSSGTLMLTEAHLIALWKRSQFPLPASGIVVFGLRGCRPVEFGGTAFAPQHAIEMRSVDYLKMNCTIGQWKPGKGIALFPGSTVPFRDLVKDAIGASGAGVNQLGCGRYSKYVPGWHKASEGSRGHWALRQSCTITIQRTADDTDYDGVDRWFAAFDFGDNIHCAFGMGPDSDIPNSKFSSAGCQTVAGLVTKGVPDSERGPWKKFIAPFKQSLTNPVQSTEYVLFPGAEVQSMIVTREAGKRIVLRFGSKGPLVRLAQAALKAQGHDLKIDGDFGQSTFRAVRDFQLETLGAVDGVIGPETAKDLGIELPEFDFQNAIDGGPGYTVSVSAPGQRRKLAWGLDVLDKHGSEEGELFLNEIIAMSERLNVDPDFMMAVMAFESGESFAPDKKNEAGSGATGLIQFMPNTAKDLGTTTAKLAQLTPTEQLFWVEKYFRRNAAGKNLASISDVYMAVLLPSAVGKPDTHPLFIQPSTAYKQNKGLDADKSGVITKNEAAFKVQEKLRTGLKSNHVG
jgi:peptidoglycan hydrolase-like protein with peptidoglycan-binding domain/uncharacterized small protein (DUF1192 family)